MGLRGESPAQLAARASSRAPIPRLASRLTFVVAWSGLRGAVSLAAALALPIDFPERNLILLVIFAVILVTLVGQGPTLPAVVRWAAGTASARRRRRNATARDAAYQAGLGEVGASARGGPDHQPLIDRLEAGLDDRSSHLADRHGRRR